MPALAVEPVVAGAAIERVVGGRCRRDISPAHRLRSAAPRSPGRRPGCSYAGVDGVVALAGGLEDLSPARRRSRIVAGATGHDVGPRAPFSRSSPPPPVKGVVAVATVHAIVEAVAGQAEPRRHRPRPSRPRSPGRRPARSGGGEDGVGAFARLLEDLIAGIVDVVACRRRCRRSVRSSPPPPFSGRRRCRRSADCRTRCRRTASCRALPVSARPSGDPQGTRSPGRSPGRSRRGPDGVRSRARRLEHLVVPRCRRSRRRCRRRPTGYRPPRRRPACPRRRRR